MRADSSTRNPATRGALSALLFSLLGLSLGLLGLLALPSAGAAQEQGTTLILPLDVAGNVRTRYAIRANRSIGEVAEANAWLTVGADSLRRPGSCLRDAACLAEVGREQRRDRVVGVRMSAAGDDFRLSVIVVASANGQSLAEQRFTLSSRELVTDTGNRLVSMIIAGPAAPRLAPVAPPPSERSQPDTQAEIAAAQSHHDDPSVEEHPDHHDPDPDTHQAIDTALTTLEEHHERGGVEEEQGPVRDTGDVPEDLEHAAHAGEQRDQHAVDDDPLGVEGHPELIDPELAPDHPHGRHRGRARPPGPWSPGWLITAAGGLMTVVGLGVGGYTLATYEGCAAESCTEAEIRDGQSVALGADVLLFGGLGTATLGIILALALAEDPPRRRDPDDLSASLSCGPTGCAGNLRLRF